PKTALGCSCMPMDDLGIRIDETPASFVGTLVEVRAAAPGGGGVFRFEVEEWVKGGPAGQVDVHSWIGDGANCGLGTDIGQELGILLYPDGEKLTSNICSITSPEMLLAAGKN